MQESSWAPHIGKAAIEEITRQSDYYRQDDLQLGYTEDLGAWVPSDQVLSYVPNIVDIEIEMLDENSNFDELRELFVLNQDVGLVLMGRNICRFTKPSVIILTTFDKYYAIVPNDLEHGIKFLAECLKNPLLTIWTTNGLTEADCLYHQYKIKLHNSRAKCCLGLHLHMMKVLSKLPEALAVYPDRAVRLAKCSNNLRLESYTRMLMIWLNLYDISEFELNHDQLIHLTKLPFNQTAINLIKKRCALVITLSQYLRFYARRELEVMNANTIISLSKTRGEQAKRVMRKVMKRSERRGTVSTFYLTFLDGCFQGAKIGDDGNI